MDAQEKAEQNQRNIQHNYDIDRCIREVNNSGFRITEMIAEIQYGNTCLGCLSFVLENTKCGYCEHRKEVARWRNTMKGR